MVGYLQNIPESAKKLSRADPPDNIRADLARIIRRPGAFTDEDYNAEAQKEALLNDCKILYAPLMVLLFWSARHS